MWWIILAPLGAFLSLNLHELAHCVVVWAIGGRVIGFKPWPHRHEGRFYLGRMTWERDTPRTKCECRWFYGIIPLRAALFMLTWVALAFSLFLPLLALAFWDLIDLGDWLKDYALNRESQDAGKYRRCA